VDSYLGSKVSYQYSVKVWKKKMLFTYEGKYVGDSFARFALFDRFKKPLQLPNLNPNF